MGTADGGAILSYINPTTLTAISIPSHLQSDVLSTLLPSRLPTKMVNVYLCYPIHANALSPYARHHVQNSISPILG